MKKFAIIGITLLLFSCSKDNSCSKELPVCISDIIKNDSAIKSIKVQTIEGECFYWIIYNKYRFQHIYNYKCDIDCTIGGFNPNDPPCFMKFESDKWETIWEK